MGNDNGEEEGLDEREPEKAICSDGQHMLFKAFSSQINNQIIDSHNKHIQQSEEECIEFGQIIKQQI